jgi:hypothetical protein
MCIPSLECETGFWRSFLLNVSLYFGEFWDFLLMFLSYLKRYVWRNVWKYELLLDFVGEMGRLSPDHFSPLFIIY